MDTQRVAELIKQIEAQEQDLVSRQTTLTEANLAVAESEAAILELKQALARELTGLLPGSKRRASSAGAPSQGKRQTGISEAVIAFFGDGQTHTIADTEAALRAEGFNPKHTAIQLSILSRAGKLKRVSRGQYAKAE